MFKVIFNDANDQKCILFTFYGDVLVLNLRIYYAALIYERVPVSFSTSIALQGNENFRLTPKSST